MLDLATLEDHALWEKGRVHVVQLSVQLLRPCRSCSSSIHDGVLYHLSAEFSAKALNAVESPDRWLEDSPFGSPLNSLKTEDVQEETRARISVHFILRLSCVNRTGLAIFHNVKKKDYWCRERVRSLPRKWNESPPPVLSAFFGAVSPKRRICWWWYPNLPWIGDDIIKDIKDRYKYMASFDSKTMTPCSNHKHGNIKSCGGNILHVSCNGNGLMLTDQKSIPLW
jgi:hypothetical protein